MRILIINPNTTASMTQSIGEAALKAAKPETTIEAVNPKSGPPSIQGPEDGAAALEGLNIVFDSHMAGQNPPDAVIIACFDDTGLEGLRARTSVPVTGIGEAAYVRAASAHGPFSVVTTLPVSIPVLEANIARYGLGAHCVRVRASGVAVLDLEHAPATAMVKIEREVIRAIAEDRCQSVVLGCAGMADLAAQLERKLNTTMIEGVSAAVAWCERETSLA
ncbi:MAG: aspartate/glutamate racemase family protein [Pseudomonadota bacterium]